MSDTDDKTHRHNIVIDPAKLPEGTGQETSPERRDRLRVGVVHWQGNNFMVTGIFRAVAYLGHEVVKFQYDERMPPNLDAVIVCGPFGTMSPLTKQLAVYTKSERPLLVYIMTEQLPNPSLPEWWRYLGGVIRSRLDRMAYQQADSGKWTVRTWLKPVVLSAQRNRYYGDLHWMKRQGILSLLTISSLWTADYLRERGFEPLVLPPSVLEGEDLKLERDIPVLWLGKTGSSRRARVLNQIRADLRARGVEMKVIDGVENPYVFGNDRTVILNRTKVVLNIMREKWDDNSMRYILAAPCRALIVSEPTLMHSPFLPGIHLVEAPIEKIADTICYYLDHDEERLEITARAFELVTQESGLGKMKLILDRVCAMKHNANAGVA